MSQIIAIVVLLGSLFLTLTPNRARQQTERINRRGR